MIKLATKVVILISTLAIPILFLYGCADMKSNRPILSVKEYERMIVGRIDAEYIGTDNCVSKCHKHEKLTNDFRRSIHGEQVKPETGLPLVNCESCHGPGSLAIRDISDDTAKNDDEKVKCRTETFLDIKSLPPQAQSLICLKCHAEASIPVLSHWSASPHALNYVSCVDCHKLHRGPGQKASREEVAELCFSCHPQVKGELQMSSRHPVREKKMSCIDCHDIHGSAQEKLLKGSTTLETCTACHAEKQGPFVYSHADVTESCNNCHLPHGSVTRPLLKASQPALCIQCHNAHPMSLIAGSSKKLYSNSCTNCHSQIHGSNIPSLSRDPAIQKPGRLLQ